MPRIKVIEHENAEGVLKDIYDDLVNKRGKLAEVHKIQSLRPKSIVKHMELYLEIMFSKSELSRAEREMIAVVVSKNNNCEYCQIHHAEALNNYWKNDEKIALFKKDFNKIDLSEKEIALCHYARTLTISPFEAKENDQTILLKCVGLSDAAILDATLVIAYFNFVNRIVLSLGVDIEQDSGKGYNY
ncbi:MAG: peroxidase-related enzyme [Flavobacteriales bacterium]|nr:peroxidase-related enzyme [Flavobacteriales bacterium]